MDSESGEPVGLTQYGTPEVDIDQIELMLVQDPQNEGLLAIAAFTYYSKGDLEKALDAYQKLVELDFRNPEYHYCLGNTFYRLQRNEEAYQQWKTTMSLDEGGRYGRRAEQRITKLGYSSS